MITKNSYVAAIPWYCYWMEFEATKTWKVNWDYSVGVVFGSMLLGWLRFFQIQWTPQKN